MKFANIFISVSWIFLLLLTLPTLLEAADINVNDRAPNLIGNDAVDQSRLNLFRLMTEMSFLRDSDNNLIIGPKGKYKTEFKHYVVVLNFFAKTCIPCLREIPTFNKLAKKYKGSHVKLLYVNVDPSLDQKQMVSLINKYNITIPVMLLNQQEAIRKYNAHQLPKLVIVGFNKRISKIVTGYNERLEVELSQHIDRLLKSNPNHE